MSYFNDESVCRKHLEKMIWNGHQKCPHCRHDKFYALPDGKTYKCSKSECRKKYTVTIGTVFQNTKVPLRKWFIAIYLVSSHKKGISSCQLSKDIEVTQSTAWLMLHRIRKMFTAYVPEIDLCDEDLIVECDETYIGGKQKNKHYNKKTKGTQGRNATNKIIVFGIMNRGGRVFSQKIENVKAETLIPLVYKEVEPGGTIVTDDWLAYRALERHYEHKYTNHSGYNYVAADDSDVHTNCMENYWSHVKRSVIGCYHHVSRKYMNSYCAEWDFRMNTRSYTEGYRFNLTLRHSLNKPT